ncbi:MAG: hypothetical protein KGI71_06465 [Patescibacteria group bacterium]|nr:hypothetical protein [Patescibacteria group bacterium]
MTTIAEVVPLYVKLRDRIRETEARHKAELVPLKEKKDVLDAWLLAELDKQKLQSVNVSGAGTVFKKKVVKVSVADWESTWKWIVDNGRYDMLNHAVNKTTVVAYVEEHQAPPPGVSYSAAFEVEVNRARGTQPENSDD